MDFFVQKVGCYPPYYLPRYDLPLCNTDKELKEFSSSLYLSKHHEIDPPCKSLEFMTFKYAEIDYKGTSYDTGGNFWMSLIVPNRIFKVCFIIYTIPQNNFLLLYISFQEYNMHLNNFNGVNAKSNNDFIYQEFTQTKAIDWQALIGNVGGYVGLVFGWSFINILPTLKITFEWIQEIVVDSFLFTKNPRRI